MEDVSMIRFCEIMTLYHSKKNMVVITYGSAIMAIFMVMRTHDIGRSFKFRSAGYLLFSVYIQREQVECPFASSFLFADEASPI